MKLNSLRLLLAVYRKLFPSDLIWTEKVLCYEGMQNVEKPTSGSEMSVWSLI